MTSIPISAATGRLADLVRRAEAGEDVVLTREGQPVARIDAVAPNSLAQERERVIAAAHVALQGVFFDETCAARSQDFLYDEDGLPA